MITAIGIMIGLYILARYAEMFDNDAGIGYKIVLVSFFLITILCLMCILMKDYQSSMPFPI